MLLTVSNNVTNASDLSIGFVGLVLCLRGGCSRGWGGFLGVGHEGSRGGARCYIYLYCRGGGWVEI